MPPPSRRGSGPLRERDSIANTRDRGAAERDSIANTRDRAAAERDIDPQLAPQPGSGEPAEVPDEAALERARLEAELQRAHLDALTGAFRREMGRLALRNEIERARRSDGKFVIAFIDVDGLKGVNDRDGHAAGDRILRTLAATMRANLRSYDPIVRFGGDEFICGISSIDPGEAQHRIGVIDQSLRNATGVGITAGLASLTSNESLEELTERADAALIEAKRNRSSRREAGAPRGARVSPCRSAPPPWQYRGASGWMGARSRLMFSAYAEVPAYPLALLVFWGAFAVFVLLVARHLRVLAAVQPGRARAPTRCRAGSAA